MREREIERGGEREERERERDRESGRKICTYLNCTESKDRTGLGD